MEYIMGLLDFFKTDKNLSEPADQVERKILWSKEFLIVGEQYECRKDKKKKRCDVISKTKLNSPVHIEKYTYQGSPAYMIVNSKLNLDLGVLSQGAASWLSEYYSKGDVTAYLINKYDGSFHVKITIYQK